MNSSAVGYTRRLHRAVVDLRLTINAQTRCQFSYCYAIVFATQLEGLDTNTLWQIAVCYENTSNGEGYGPIYSCRLDSLYLAGHDPARRFLSACCGVTILRPACTITEVPRTPDCNVLAIQTEQTEDADTTAQEDQSINGMLDLRSAASGQTHRDTNHALYVPGSRRTTSRKLAPVLVLAILIGLTALRTTAALADSVVSSTATVTSPDGLNLRSSPGTVSIVLAVMPFGANVTVAGSGTPDNWLPVAFNSQLGWADSTFLSVNQGTPPPPVVVSTSATVMPADGLNLRSGPGASFAVVTVIPGSASITITGLAQNSWLPATFGSYTGWINGAFVSTDGTSAMISSNASSATAGASIASSAGTTGTGRDASVIANSAPSAGAVVGTKLAWPDQSRRISTVFSPSHLGIDIDEYPGSGNPAYASAAGTVSFAGGDACCSYGLYVIIDHPDGMQTLYAHFSNIAVQKGQQVTQGQRIGVSGCTGRCTGPHIHYEVRINGKQVDPLRYLPSPWSIE